VSLSVLTAADVARVMGAYEASLAQHRDVINRLNVYPVPDGDTGTNMHLTLESVGRELALLGESEDMGAICKAISHGSLMGARGNSGVILCQILRGLSGVFSAAGQVGETELASGLTEANTAARSGVMRPVEGTILTVARAAAEAAEIAAGELVGLLGVGEAARSAAVVALHRTPELLPVLAAAGVVDAGGAGLVLLFDSILHVIDGRQLPALLPLPDSVVAMLGGSGPIGPSEGPDGGGSLPPGMAEMRDLAHGDVSELRYEVMYFLEAPDDSVPAFREVWAGIGDSIVVVGGDGLWNCHIHTDDVGAAIEAALDAGRPRQIRVTDLMEQVEEESWVRRAEAAGVTSALAPDGSPPPVTSVVAVATGDGIRRIFHSLGVRHVVAGGQSMNPSTEQILEVIDATPGSEVVVLPNNKNIFAVAAQACELSEKPARAVATEGIQEGFAALLDYDPEAGAEENAASMTLAAARVVAGDVTQAVRASDSPAGPIAIGDWIGLSRGGICSVGGSASEATCRLLEALLAENHEIVTIIEGAGATAAATRRITEWLADQHPEVAVELHQGGQPLYPYLVAAE
jgi:hypothetical protein